MGHQDGKGDEMQPSQRLCQAFTIASQPIEACHPGKAALDNPTAWQKYEAMLGSSSLTSNRMPCAWASAAG